MAKHLEYIVVAATALIFTLYHAVLTSLVIARMDNLDLSFGYIFFVEIIAFIPIVSGMLIVMWLGKKKPELFTALSYSVLIKHALFALTLFVIHAYWQPSVNALFFGDTVTFMAFKEDFISFLEMRFLVYVIIVGLVSGLIKIREQKEIIVKESELNLRLQKARLKELEFKMNPEIIYPNLGFIKEKAATNPEAASQMIILMAGILRRLVDNMDDEKVRVSEEAKFFTNYFELLKLRLEKNIIVNIVLEGFIENEKVPSLILIIPFFEELFFGKYAKNLANVDEVTFSAKRMISEKLEEKVVIKNVSDIHFLTKNLEMEPLLENINNLLVELAKGEFSFSTQIRETELILKLVSSQRKHEESHA